ncbi:hypothetical protein MRX96_046882, partial [Rhipicephalus microplus]
GNDEPHDSVVFNAAPRGVCRKSICGYGALYDGDAASTVTRGQIKAVLALLLAFLITLLGALCYALFSFLTAPPEPTVQADTSMTDEQTTTSTDESTTEDVPSTLTSTTDTILPPPAPQPSPRPPTPGPPSP